MKIKFTLILALAFISLISTSCRKCVQCSFSVDSTSYLSEKECGSIKERDGLQSEWEQRAQDSSATASCVTQNN